MKKVPRSREKIYANAGMATACKTTAAKPKDRMTRFLESNEGQSVFRIVLRELFACPCCVKEDRSTMLCGRACRFAAKGELVCDLLGTDSCRYMERITIA